MRISKTLGFHSKSWRAALLATAVLPLGAVAVAQETTETESEVKQLDVVVVTGIRASLQNALNEKRASANLKEVILAEDIGKLPDQNLAEVLENLSGVQITRTAGVGTGVQIRGTNANRTEINGVSTVGSGSGRSGISFEDVSASMIAGVEVTKSPEAKTVEGSVGGTVNLRTIRPLDLEDRLTSVRVQFEESSLSTDGMTPRLSGTYGNNWDTEMGEIGFVGSLSYAEQDVTAFRPRTDRDNLITSDSGAASAQSFDYLPIQFLIQDYDNFEYQTTNFAGTLEWAPNDDMKFFADVVINEQERRQESSRIQASGVSGLISVQAPDTFETVNFGSLDGQNIGSIEAALTGSIPLDSDGSDGNLRFSGDTNSRITDSAIYSVGGEWDVTERLSARVEFSTSQSDTTTPSFNTTLNFINPNSPLDYDALLANHFANEASGSETLYDSNENGTPFVYDLRGALTWGIDFASADAPTTAQLLDPANIVLRDVSIGANETENQEDAFRADFSYDLTDMGFGDFLTSVDLGYRYNKTSSVFDQITTSVGLRELADSPTGDLFADLLIPGPSNFGDADGRALFVSDFLVINPELVADNPDAVLATLNAAITANNAVTGSTRASISEPTSNQNGFFDIEESTNSLYGQANFEYGIFRGNAGVRYVETEVTSTGNQTVNGVTTLTSTTGSYDFILPRFNLVASPREDLLIRAGWGRDIRRPDFNDLNTSFTFSTSPNPAVSLGNPALEPEEVESFDITAEWYFAPSAVVSVGYFNKKRTGLFVSETEEPVTTTVTDANGAIVDVRDVSAPCEGGGIFNPIADQNVFAPLDANGNQTTGVGVCVPLSQIINSSGDSTLQGIELAFQYDLSSFEDRLGWASGFGMVANYTWMDFSGSDETLSPTSRATDVFDALGATNVTLQFPEIDQSENAYNLTGYYEKYGLSARVRYTWRDAYRSTDFGSTSSFPWGFPVVQEARGQLNASVTYEVNDNLSVGLEGVNLTESEVEQSCVNEGALLCFQGLTDRRVTFGATLSF